MSTSSPMAENSKIPWPATYLGRLQTVAAELGRMEGPASVAMVEARFSGVTTEQIEAILAALVLFGRIDKKGELFTVPKNG